MNSVNERHRPGPAAVEGLPDLLGWVLGGRLEPPRRFM